MKGFKPAGKGAVKMGHSFPKRAGFTGSTGKVRQVRPYTQRVPTKAPLRKAAGGSVPGPGSSDGHTVVQRRLPVTEFDKEFGGKGPLRPGFLGGGYVARPPQLTPPGRAPVGGRGPSPIPRVTPAAPQMGARRTVSPVVGGGRRAFAEGGRVKPRFAPGGGSPYQQHKSIRANFASRVPVERSPIVETKEGMKHKSKKAYDRVMKLGKFAEGGKVRTIPSRKNGVVTYVERPRRSSANPHPTPAGEQGHNSSLSLLNRKRREEMGL